MTARSEDWQEQAERENAEMNRREVEGDPNAPEWSPEYKRWQTVQAYRVDS